MLRRMELGTSVEASQYFDAYNTMLAFRASHQYPLVKATMGLRSVVASEGCSIEVSQRLKRVPTILDKLKRHPEMSLERMQDIGGCRAVLSSINEVERVQQRVVTNARRREPGREPRVRNYIAEPRESGYRGIHVIVRYDERSIEIQLRTQVMHAWAISVERLSGRLREDLKGGYGPAQVLALLETISEAMAIEEVGGTVGQDLLDRMEAQRQVSLKYLQGGSR